MPLEDPIIEKIKPSMERARITDSAVPENILPILTLLRCRALSYKDSYGIEFWELTTEDGLHYIRIQKHYILGDESEWTRAVGMLLDYAKSKGGE